MNFNAKLDYYYTEFIICFIDKDLNTLLESLIVNPQYFQ